MEFLLTVAGLIVLAFLWRGVSWLRDYQRRLRVRLEPVPKGPEQVETFPELGKVRVRPRFAGDEDGQADEPLPGPAIVAARHGREMAPEPRPTVTPVSVASLRSAAAERPREEVPASAASRAESVADDVPVLVAEEGIAQAPRVVPSAPRDAAWGSDEPVLSTPVETLPVAETAMPAKAEVEQPPVPPSPAANPAQAVEQHDMFADERVAPPPMPGRRTPAQSLYETAPVEPVRPVRPVEEKSHVEVQDVIVLHVFARKYPFNGEDLLRCILSYGLRFGEMAIFHRHERPTGQGKVLFSMAKAVEPGTFDLNAMSGEEVPGVSFFLSLPGVSSILAYDIMVDTARRLATELHGDVLDEQQQPLTRQLVEHYRERVQEFERRRLTQRPPR